MNQKINRGENPIVFLTVFSLFVRVPYVGLTKSLYSSRNFVFYNMPVKGLNLVA